MRRGSGKSPRSTRESVPVVGRDARFAACRFHAQNTASAIAKTRWKRKEIPMSGENGIGLRSDGYPVGTSPDRFALSSKDDLEEAFDKHPGVHEPGQEVSGDIEEEVRALPFYGGIEGNEDGLRQEEEDERLRIEDRIHERHGEEEYGEEEAVAELARELEGSRRALEGETVVFPEVLPVAAVPAKHLPYIGREVRGILGVDDRLGLEGYLAAEGVELEGEIEVLGDRIVIETELVLQGIRTKGGGASGDDEHESDEGLRPFVDVLSDGIVYLPARGQPVVLDTLHVAGDRGRFRVFEMRQYPFHESRIEKGVGIRRDDDVSGDIGEALFLGAALVARILRKPDQSEFRMSVGQHFYQIGGPVA